MHDETDTIFKQAKLSAKKAKKKGVLRSEPQAFSLTKGKLETATEQNGLITSVSGNTASVLVNEILYEATASASLMTDCAVGDKVTVDLETTPIRILSLQPRHTELARTKGEGGSRHRKQKQVIAANINIAVIVATATNPAFGPELVDRYIILSKAAGIEPIICLNKSDLTTERHPAIEWYRHQGMVVIETSPKTGLGLNELRQTIRGKTAILLGKSGAGKSSLINAIDPNANIKTQTLSEHAQQGQHTTTRSDIHVLEPNTYLIDTPGIRTLDISHVDEDDIAIGFPDINELAQSCRFSDCHHYKEPGCAVKQAIETRKLPTWRWESYQNIKMEK